MAGRKTTRERIEAMSFGLVYPLYVDKVEKKGKTVAELHQVMTWLMGYSEPEILALAASDATFKDLFDGAMMHSNTHLIKGVVCGHRVEDIEDDLVQKTRYLDKVIDELARGKKMQSILRTA